MNHNLSIRSLSPICLMMLVSLTFTLPAAAWQDEESTRQSTATAKPAPATPDSKATTDSKATQSSAMERIRAASKKLGTEKKYHLRYNMSEGQQLRWHHEHVITSRSQMAGVTVETSSRDQSDFVWTVKSVDDVGQIAFDITLEAVNLWSRNAKETPLTYNSRVDAKPPELYVTTAEKIGKPLSEYQITHNGQLVDSKSNYRKADIGGIGDTPTFPFPDKPIGVGHQWDVPDTLQAKNEHGVYQKLKTQVQYELKKVKSGKAYISFKTQVLTPLESEKVKSQILTHLAKGYIVFDLEKGLPIRREVEWDERVQGYKGPDSYLKYTARRTEKLIEGNTLGDAALPVTHAKAALQPLGKKASSKKAVANEPGTNEPGTPAPATKTEAPSKANANDDK